MTRKQVRAAVEKIHGPMAKTFAAYERTIARYNAALEKIRAQCSHPVSVSAGRGTGCTKCADCGKWKD